MVEKGYPKPFSAAVTACSAVIGPVIPPSINMLIFASVASVSVGKMFVAGILPGIVICIYEMIVTWFIAKRRNYGVVTKFSWKQFLHALKRGFRRFSRQLSLWAEYCSAGTPRPRLR